MILYHASPRRIRGRYVRVSKARTYLPVVWCFRRPFVVWACEHVLLRHGCPNGPVYVYRVRVKKADAIFYRGGIILSRADAEIVGRERFASPYASGKRKRNPYHKAK